MTTTPTKERVLRALEAREGAHVSGAQLARELGVTRNSVWKAVNALRREGYHIDATTNRGYALSHEDDLLSASGIRRFLPADAPLLPTVRKSLDSTNAEALRRAVDGAPEGTVIVAEEQTAGRGRRGRSFFSPAGTGIYLSILVRPALAAERAHLLTCSAAVAVAEAIEACAGVDASIKWVNDVYCRGKKVAGILTEGSFDLEGGVLQHAVVGIGVNVRPPHAGFPAEIAERAGAVLPARDATLPTDNAASPASDMTPSAGVAALPAGTASLQAAGAPLSAGDPSLPASTAAPPTDAATPPASDANPPADGTALRRASTVRCRLVAEILTRFWTLYQGLQTSNGQEGTRLLADVRERYRNRCFLLGQDVMVTRGGESIRAHAVDLDESFRLVVKLPDGTRHALSYGEAALTCP